MEFHQYCGRDGFRAGKSIYQLVGEKSDQYLKFTQPFFAIIGLLFAEREINKVPVTGLCDSKWDHMLRHVAEIISSIRVQT